MTLSFRNRLLAVLFSTAVFSAVVLAFLLRLSDSPERALTMSLTIGFALGVFEEFYVRSKAGRWLRAMHPVKSILVYACAIAVFMLGVMLINLTVFGPMHGTAPVSLEQGTLPRAVYVLPLLVVATLAALMTLRIIGYVGGKNLLHLLTGRYHRPRQERRIFLFLDLKHSTATVDSLGAVRARAMIGKFFFDVSAPITDLGGDIYRFTGDGLVAVWEWNSGSRNNRIVRAIDAITMAVRREAEVYRQQFGRIPEFRIGVHGGPIIVCEEGDTRRAIGYYGETIHIAARLEQQARDLGQDCLLSKPIADLQSGCEGRLSPVGELQLRGLRVAVDAYALHLET